MPMRNMALLCLAAFAFVVFFVGIMMSQTPVPHIIKLIQ